MKKLNFFKNNKIADLALITLFLIVIIANTMDLIEDGFYRDDAWLKLLTVVLSLWGVTMLIRMIKDQSKEMSALHKKVERTENDLELSHVKLKEIGREYSKYLHKQFDAWELTPSEKEVALILLKGLSFKEMAEVRHTKEKTIRQQASTIYRKSNVSGRHEFSAWFFEDMLV
jgi:DNA-binding CsgD family transcriptional regulator